MKIAVASQNRKEITGHTGHCRKFWIYTTEGKTIIDKSLLELSKEQSLHQSFPNEPWALDHVQVLIAGWIGKGLARRLEAKNIKVVATAEKDTDRAVNDLLNGVLKEESLRHREHGCKQKRD